MSPRLEKTNSPLTEWNSFQEYHLLDRKITSDGSFFVKRQQRPPLVPMMDVGNQAEEVGQQFAKHHGAKYSARHLHSAVKPYRAPLWMRCNREKHRVAFLKEK